MLEECALFDLIYRYGILFCMKSRNYIYNVTFSRHSLKLFFEIADEFDMLTSILRLTDLQTILIIVFFLILILKNEILKLV